MQDLRKPPSFPGAHSAVPCSPWGGPGGLLRRARPLLPILALLLLSASSCDNSLQGEGDPPLPTGLKIVGGLPAFPTVENPDYVVFDLPWPASLRLDLNQTAQPSDLLFSFAPAPLKGWSPRASQTAPLFWIDGFAPDSSTVLQTIVIDGPRFLHPWLWEFWAKEPVGPYGIITADVVQNHSTGPSPAYALMLFYERDVATNANTPGELFRLPAQRSALAVTDITDIGSLPSDGTPRFERVADALVQGKEYTMAVILDTSGDGVYDPQSDWWGTAHTNQSGQWIPWYVSAQPPLLSHLLEAELLPPPVD